MLFMVFIKLINMTSKTTDNQSQKASEKKRGL